MPSKFRAYTAAHRRRRADLLPLALGALCPCGEQGCTHRCDGLMVNPRRMDLDHTTPTVLGNTGPGDRIICSTCNRSAGATLGNQLRQPASRDW